MASLVINQFAKSKSLVLSNIIKYQISQSRNTFILKRQIPVPLHKKGGKPGKFKSRHFLYDLVEDTTVKRAPDLQIVLTSYVEGVGNAGDLVSMRPNQAYRELLMPGLAVYASPKNIETYKNEDAVKEQEEKEHSSPYAQQTADSLSRLVLQISMNKIVPWTLEKWHIRTSFRKAGFVVPEHAFDLPDQKITGPDLSLQDKEFYIVVTINGKEKANVRCRIHHWAKGVDRLPWVEHHWKQPKEPLYPEQAEALAEMPLPQ